MSDDSADSFSLSLVCIAITPTAATPRSAGPAASNWDSVGEKREDTQSMEELRSWVVLTQSSVLR